MGPIEGPNKISKVGTNCSLSERPNIQIPSAPPIYGKVVNLPEFGKDHSRRSTAQDLGEPMAMSFNINDAVLHEEASNGGNKYLATLLSSPSISNYCRANDNIQEQVFLNHPQTNSANQVKNFNNYVWKNGDCKRPKGSNKKSEALPHFKAFTQKKLFFYPMFVVRTIARTSFVFLIKFLFLFYVL